MLKRRKKQVSNIVKKAEWPFHKRVSANLLSLTDNKFSKRFQKTYLLCIIRKSAFGYDKNVFNSREYGFCQE